MAFSKQPTQSTYSTKTVGLLKELGSRGNDTAKDSFYLNAYAEVQKNKTTKEEELIAVSRAGTSTVVESLGSDGVRGAWVWKDIGQVFICIGRHIYVYSADTYALTTTLTNFFVSSTGHVGFTEFLYSTTDTKLVVTDGTEIRAIDTLYAITSSVGHPTHLPYPIFLDGYLFVVKTNSSSIFNSDQDNPLTWVGGDFVDAEMNPDELLRIALLNNYVVAFGRKTIEYFYDAANASGSPLSRNESPLKQVGYLGGFAQLGNRIYFIGEVSESSADIFLLEDFKITPLGTESVRRHLEVQDANASVAACVSFNGHDFYTFSTAGATYALEMETKLWGKMSYKSNGTFPINFSMYYYNTGFFTTTIDQSINIFNSSLYKDGVTTFPVQIVTDNEYFDSYNRKVCNRLSLVADRVAASVLVQTSDDDYQTWSTGQTISLDQELPCAYRWGQFRRRAHKLTFQADAPLRIRKLELDINLGNS